jgi:hypothetical protein
MWFNPSDFKKSAEDPAAIFAIPAIPETQNSKTAKIAMPYLVIPEIENSKIAGIANRSESNNAALSVIVSAPSGKILSVPDEDDRHHCYECMDLRNGYCIKQRFRPVDDIPRRCEDFNGYPDQIGQQVSGTIAPAPAANHLLVEVWTPSGTAMTIRADNAEHAEWLRKMNRKMNQEPKIPALKPDPTPEHDADRISEVEYNAQGLFYQFLITRQDGSQFLSCTMPRQTLEETRAQYPEAEAVEPVFWETEKISP